MRTIKRWWLGVYLAQKLFEILASMNVGEHLLSEEIDVIYHKQALIAAPINHPRETGILEELKLNGCRKWYFYHRHESIPEHDVFAIIP